MKNFPRLVAVCLCALFPLLSLTACGESAPALGTAWSKTATRTYTYDLSFTAGESLCGYEFALTEGTFTQKIIPSQEGDELRYTLETVLTVEGSYTDGDGAVTPVNDQTVATTLLHDVQNYDLFPVSSEKTLKQTGVVREGVNFALKEMDYRLTVDYGKKSANATFYGHGDGGYDQEIPHTRPTQKYTKLKGAFFDNESLLFVTRAFEIGKGFSTTFSTIDVINGQKTKLYFKVASEDRFARNYTVNGAPVSYNTLKATLSINDKMAGSSYTLYYADLSAEERNVVTELQTKMPYGMGTLTYTLCKVE